ncbi:hypothetical protein MSG28_012928 [Choristoneura fumiferana]|uniref:Uncharacterized protein n=1 Tax=Choristoneura fumiferana TaxID=7141 RepID=A0ACC0KRE8_CHOFU|nr:hypothetical protein MSG28_012928 [Choristoneura fumiferana]
MAELAAPQMATNTLRINSPSKEDYGLESISEELPIVEPERPVFRSPQLRFSLNPALSPQRPAIPQAHKKPSVKFPIPRAVMGPKLPKMPAKKEPVMITVANAPARPVNPNVHKPPSGHDQNVTEERGKLRRGDLDISAYQLKVKILHLMEQVIYHTQDGNMVQVEEMAAKYHLTKQYRMAFICLKMDEVKNEMHAMLTYLEKHKK